jgi:hypothetical protein
VADGLRAIFAAGSCEIASSTLEFKYHKHYLYPVRVYSLGDGCNSRLFLNCKENKYITLNYQNLSTLLMPLEGLVFALKRGRNSPDTSKLYLTRGDCSQEVLISYKTISWDVRDSLLTRAW